MKTMSVVRSAGAAALTAAAAIGLYASPAFASAQTGSVPAGTPFDIGPSPVALPSSCPFPNEDANFVFLSGNEVQHGTMNANGDWGGMTMEGTAVFYENSTPWYQGHLTIWQGGGNNAKAQSEGGLTLNFSGTGPAGTLQLHVNFHGTTNATGQPTASVQNVSASCG